MKPLASNRELFEYLIHLYAELTRQALVELAEVVGFAIRQGAGNMSAEFLGESRLALRRVQREAGDTLTVQEREDLSAVLRQLDEAFDRR